MNLALQALNEPTPCVGVWLSAPRNLLEIVDAEGDEPYPGSVGSRWFNAYAIAGETKRDASQVADEWTDELADEVLNLDRSQHR